MGQSNARRGFKCGGWDFFYRYALLNLDVMVSFLWNCWVARELWDGGIGVSGILLLCFLVFMFCYKGEAGG